MQTHCIQGSSQTAATTTANGIGGCGVASKYLKKIYIKKWNLKGTGHLKHACFIQQLEETKPKTETEDFVQEVKRNHLR